LQIGRKIQRDRHGSNLASLADAGQLPGRSDSRFLKNALSYALVALGNVPAKKQPVPGVIPTLPAR
jgi:hypothetical protein